MCQVKKLGCGLICVLYAFVTQAQVNNFHPKKKSASLRGTFGASSSFYHSNEAVNSRPLSAYNINGNFTARVKEVSLPFSFVVSQYGQSNLPAHVQVGISPTYRWAKLLLGFRSMRFSPLIYSGQTFKGAGIELNPKQLRFAAFYGRLNKPINQDTIAGRFRAPQYSRKGYGVKIGIGNAKRFFDVMYLHAEDDSSSARILNTNTRNNLHAQENAVVGSSFKLTMIKKLIWTGDMAISGLIPDITPGKKSFDSSHQKLKNFIDDFLPGSANLQAGYAGQSSLYYRSKTYTGNFGYRRVAPNFRSLGTPYLLRDIELLTLNNTHTIAKGKLNLSTSLSQQHNNLDKNSKTELRTQVGNINANAILSQHWTINANYSGYNLKQKNGNPGLPDSLRINDTILLKQRISQFTAGPSFNITKGNIMHYMNGNVSVQKLKDKNATTAARTNSNNLSASLSYTLSFIQEALGFSIDYSLSNYKQQGNSYKSNGIIFGTSSQLLKNKSLNIQGNFGYYLNKFSATASTQKNISYSGNIGYNVKRHSFNVFANYVYTPVNNEITNAIDKTFPYAVATKNFSGGVSYSYSIF